MEACAQTGFGAELAPAKRAKFQDAHTNFQTQKKFQFSENCTSTWDSDLPESEIERDVLLAEAEVVLRWMHAPRVVPFTTPSRAQRPNFTLDRRTTTATPNLTLTSQQIRRRQALLQRRALLVQSTASGTNSCESSRSKSTNARKRKNLPVRELSWAPAAPTRGQIHEALGADPQPHARRNARLEWARTLCSSVDLRTVRGKRVQFSAEFCRVTGCGRKVLARQLCNRHYQVGLRAVKEGSPVEFFS